MAAILDTTVGYLLSESNEGKILQDTAKLKVSMKFLRCPIKTKNIFSIPSTGR
jgi:hypothetical protein